LHEVHCCAVVLCAAPHLLIVMDVAVASRAGAAPLVMADNAVTRRANYNLLCRRGLINAGGRWRNLLQHCMGYNGMGSYWMGSTGMG